MGQNTKRRETNGTPQETQATPEPTRTCLYCAYSFWDASRFLANTMTGRPDRTCRNFRFKRQPVVRAEPPEPPDERIRIVPPSQKNGGPHLGCYSPMDPHSHCGRRRLS